MKAGRTVIAAAAAVSLLGVAGTAIADDGGGTSRGPSTATDPYVLPVAKGVHVKSLLTVEDAGSADGYEMVGIPDGLGALALSGGDFSVFMNHELPREKGIVRRHGQTGSFVSKLEIDEETLEVEEGSDLIDPGVRFWNYPTASYSSSPSPAGPNPRKAGDAFLAQMAAFNRFCSSTLTDEGQLYNHETRNGYGGRIYFGNEEGGDESRTFGITESGRATQLPRLGLFSWENTVPARNRSDTTLSMGNEDTATGQLWSYIGKKQRSGSAVAEAGLTNGANYVMDIKDESISTDAQFRTKYGKGKDARFDLSEVSWDQSGKAQNTEAAAEGITLNRIEDGAWDPRHRRDYYFVTTEGGKGATTGGVSGRDGGGLWRARFDDIEDPQKGGELELLLDGSEAPLLNKPDNMTIDHEGNLLMQEDPGNNTQLARIVAYDIDSGRRGVLAQFDEAIFSTPAPTTTPGSTPVAASAAKPTTIDEESSGIIDASDQIGEGWFLFDAQVHRENPNPEYVEYGQLLAMKVASFGRVYTIKR